MEISCGQVWKVVNPKYHDMRTGDLVIILSLDREYWQVGSFWMFDGKMGGARQGNFTEKEIAETLEYVGHISELSKSK